MPNTQRQPYGAGNGKCQTYEGAAGGRHKPCTEQARARENQFCVLATTEVEETHAQAGLNTCVSVFAVQVPPAIMVTSVERIARVLVTFLLCPAVLGLAALLTFQILLYWSVARGRRTVRLLPRYHFVKSRGRGPSRQSARA